MISPAKRGRVVELLAEAMFLAAGFEVFTNVSADGPADLVIWDGENTYLIDTKKCQKRIQADGTIAWTNNTLKGRHPDVLVLGHCEGDWIWLSEVPEALSSII